MAVRIFYVREFANRYARAVTNVNGRRPSWFQDLAGYRVQDDELSVEASDAIVKLLEDSVPCNRITRQMVKLAMEGQS